MNPFDKNPFDMDLQDMKKAMDFYENLSADDKDSLSRIAREMFGESLFNSAFQNADVSEEQEESPAILNLSPEVFSRLNQESVDLLQDALELEEFYSEDDQADFSPVVLLYGKALLHALRNFLDTKRADGSTLRNQSLFELAHEPLFQETSIDPVFLNQTAILLSRVMNDRISREEMEFFKSQLQESRIFEQLLEERAD